MTEHNPYVDHAAEARYHANEAIRHARRSIRFAWIASIVAGANIVFQLLRIKFGW